MASDDSRDASGGAPPKDEAADDDDLASLAGSLGSIHPPEAGAEADDVDLKALTALSNRSSTVSQEPEDATVRLSGAVEAASPPAPRASAAPAAAQPRPVVDSEPVAVAGRATWVTPLLVGLGLGVGAAGLAFGLSARQSEARAADVASAPATTAAPEPTPAPAAPSAAAAPEAAPAAATPASPAALAAVAGAPPSGTPETPPAAQAAAAGPSRTAGASREPASRPTPAGAAARSAEQPPVQLGSPAPAAPDGPVLAMRPVVDPPAGTAASAAPEAPSQAGAKRGTSVDELLDQALAPPARAAALRAEQEAAMEQDALPETPSREAVTKAMTTMLPAISGCAMGHSGMATATIVVRGDGRVASAEIAGAPFSGGPSGRCMEGVIRRATFPHFRQPIFRIKYPLSIQ